MSQSLRHIFVGVVMLACVTVARAAAPQQQKTYTEAEAWLIGSPSITGPFGNFLTLRCGAPIADDLLKARLVWISEDADFGTAKTGSQTWASAGRVTERLGPQARTHPGNWAGVIVAEGKVFASSFRPTGEYCTGEVKGEKAQFRLDAEDIVIALDAQTGKVAWKAAEPGGVVLSGGKRGGFQVSPVYHDAKVFSMGSTGRLFAYVAASGQRLWTSDIGPAHKHAAAQREQVLAAAEQGQWNAPEGRGWHSSLVVAEGVLIAPTFAGGNDTGLRGIDIKDGSTKWEVPNAISKYATPNVWRHGGREYLLCATISGAMRLIDPRDGKVLWEVTGLGPNYPTLAPSEKTVLVNVAKIDDPKAKRVPGFYGAYRISPEGADKAWEMPREERNQIPTWFDSCARQRYLIRDGVVYVSPEGTKQNRPSFVLLDEETGEVLAEHKNTGSETECIGGLMYLVEDRLLCRGDSVHGPTHGGRHPFVQWRVAPGKIARMGDEGSGLCHLDLVDFTNGYEVYMETPIVAGRMFERTVDGRLACVDLRRPEGLTTWELDLAGGYIGLPSLPLRLWTREDGTVHGGKAYPPDDRQVGVPFGQSRRFARWEVVENIDARVDGERLSGTIRIGFGSHAWPVKIDILRSGDNVSGEWRRPIEHLCEIARSSGAVKGIGPSKDRVYPTPWLASQPLTRMGENPDGTVTYALDLVGVITLGAKPTGLTVCLDHDGTAVTRAAAGAFGFSQSWHEVDASRLTIADGKIAGKIIVVLNGDWWKTPNPTAGTGIAAEIDLDVSLTADGPAGTYSAGLGVPWQFSGSVNGTIRPQE